MALGTLHAAFAGLGIESVIGGNHGIQARGTTFNQRPIFNNTPSRGTNVVALPRQQQARLGQLTQSASAFLETDYRSAAPNRGSRGSYAIPVPDIASVRSFGESCSVIAPCFDLAADVQLLDFVRCHSLARPSCYAS